MSRIRVGSQLLSSTLRAATPSPHHSVNLLPRCISRSFTQTCSRSEDKGSDKPAAPLSPAAPAATPKQGQADSIFGSPPGAPQAPFSQPSPLPRTASWHAATSGASQPSTPAGENSSSSLTELSKMRLGPNNFGANFIESALSVSGDPERQALERAMNVQAEPFHLHIYAHKHNTHITLTRPNNDVVISVSNGNLGFKHSKRKHYDAAYQLMQHMVSLIEKKGLLPHIPNIEVVLKGFGQGRDAAAKVLLSPEGVEIKKKIVRVADATTLKFGGTRSKNPRRI